MSFAERVTSALMAFSTEMEPPGRTPSFDGGCEAAMTYVSDEWMARLLLGFGPDVQVLAPESLVQRVRTTAEAAVAAYQAAPGGQ